jgi:hypothetical protein
MDGESLVARLRHLVPLELGSAAARTRPRPALDDARAALRRAEWTHRALVVARKAQVARAERDHQRAVRRAAAELSAADAARAEAVARRREAIEALRRGTRLASYGELVLYDDRLEAPGATLALSRELSALVDTAPHLSAARPAALARLGPGRAPRRLLSDLAAGRQSRHYLLLDSPAFATVVECRGDPEEARAFAAQVSVAALNADRLQEERRRAIRHAERELETADQELARQVLEAFRRLQEARSDASGVERAKAWLELAEEDTAEIERLREEVRRLQAAG